MAGETAISAPGQIQQSQQPPFLPIDQLPTPTPSERKIVSTAKFPNLAKDLSPEFLQHLGQEIVTNYNNDLGSMSKYITRLAKWQKLITMQTDPKTHPWPNAANVPLPVLATACIQFQARAFEALIPSKKVMKSFPISTDPSVVEAADRIETHMNYQLNVQMKEFKPGMDSSLMQLANNGTVIRKQFFDPIKKRNVSDFVQADSFIINYNTRNLDDSERYTHKMPMSLNKIKINQKKGRYLPVDLENEEAASPKDNGPQGSTDIAVPEATQTELKTQSDQSNAIQATPGTNTRVILEQHVFLDLTGKGEIQKPYIAIVDLETQKVLRIVARINPETKEKMDFFTRYIFIPNPDGGFFGIGFGMLLEGSNEAINTLVNQLIDAGTLANTKGGFVQKGSGIKKGDLAFTQGEFKAVNTQGDDIRKIIMPMDFGSPSNTLFTLLGLLQEYANRVTTVSEITTGEMPKSDTPATTIAALIEQGMKVFSTIHKRTHLSFQQELSKLFTLNSIHTDEEEYVMIVANIDEIILKDAKPEIIRAKPQKRDYSRNVQIIPVSDPNITSRVEKISKAQTAYELALSNPISSQNPEVIQAAFRGYLDALEIPDGLIEGLTQVPPPPVPPNISQPEEIREFFNERFIEALPEQSHPEHLGFIEEFEQSPLFQTMPATSKTLLAQHKNQHLGFMSEQFLVAQDQAIQQGMLGQLEGGVA